MTPPRLLGIDLGTSSVKVVVVGLDGTVLGLGTASYPTNHPAPNQAEQDPEAWWRATMSAVQGALAAAGSSDVAAIGVTGQMHGTVLLDAHGDVIAPAIIWADGRSTDEVAAMTAEIRPERLIEITGSPLAPGFQAATLRWVRDHRPDIWSRVQTVATPIDFIRYKLTGEHAVDPSDASGTLLCDVRTRDWADDLLRAAGVDRDHLPPIRPSAAISGTLSATAASALGIRPGTPVATGGADAPCAALGSGVVGTDTLLLTFSTGAQALLPRFDVDVDRQGRLHTFCSVLDPARGAPGWYTMGATLTAGMALSWLRDKLFDLKGPDSTADMLSWADDVPAGSRGLIFLPYLIGERTPLMNPAARGVYLGLTARHGRGELVRAAVEGIGFAAYDAYLALRSLGTFPERIVVAGGGAKVPLWRQTVADIFGLPVFPLVGDEQTVRGAAILAGAAVGRLDPVDAARTWAHEGAPSIPNPESADRYHALFAIFQRTYRHLERDMALLGEFE